MLPITDYALLITDHGLPITHHASSKRTNWNNMNAMPRVIPMCPNMNMIHILSLRDKNYQRYFIE